MEGCESPNDVRIKCIFIIEILTIFELLSLLSVVLASDLKTI